MKHDRRLRRVGPADHRHADGDARLQPQAGQDLRRLLAGTARSGTAASAGRCWARPGSTTTATTARRARAASSRRASRDHPILRGIKDGDIWGPTDVYGVRLPLPGDSKPLVLGQVLEGMKPDRQAGRGQEERPDDAGRLGQDLHRQGGQARARLHDHDGRLAGPARARACAGCSSTPATGPSASRTRSPRRPT